MAEKNWRQDFFTPRNPQKYIGDLKEIVFRSSWEKRFFEFCDETSSIKKWSSEPFSIQYWDESTMKSRRYFPDAYMIVEDAQGNEKKYLVEIKPYKQTIPPKEGRKKTQTYLNECRTYQKNESKWKFAREFCEKNDLEFMIITEYELGLAKR